MIWYNLIATSVHKKLRRKFKIKGTKTWYEHVPLPHTLTQTGIKILWDDKIKTITKIEHNRYNIVVKTPGERKWQLIKIAIPQYHFQIFFLNLLKNLEHFEFLGTKFQFLCRTDQYLYFYVAGAHLLENDFDEF